jgi:hypothetical protein
MQTPLIHRTTPRFWACYANLPEAVQRLADSCFALLKEDPLNPSLHFKKIARFRSVRVGLFYRALGVTHESSIAWFWIGTHGEYDALLRRL